MVALRASVSLALLAAVLALVGYYYGFDDILNNLRKLSVSVAGTTAVALVANALGAAIRFKVIASDTGHPINFRRAMAAVGAGSLAGAIFFQIAGQLMARGVIMKRGGMPFGAVVVVTLYERIVAALLSALIAVFGALYVFGRVYLDTSTGGIDLIKLACGVIAAMACAAWLGFGRTAIDNIKPLVTWRFIVRLLRVVGLTLAVQLPMMVAYVAVAHAFSPATPIGDLVAASAIVMFAASVPISLAGWGVRELSAVVALGAIGVAASDALTAAIMIGAGSMLAMALMIIVSFQARVPEKEMSAAADVQVLDYAQALAWILPLAAAVFVFFQIYVPVGSGLLNVNLADPVAILAGSFFVLKAIKNRQLPRWRVDHVNISVAIATAVLTGSLLIGAGHFGWTNWALVNRFLGWFVLLAFAMTGALITSTGGMRAFRIFVLSYVGASIGVMFVEVGLAYLRALGVPNLADLVQPGNLQAFAQNRNFFAFQLLMAAAGAMVMLRDERLRRLFLVLLVVAIWFTGSRSGWASLAVLIGASLYLRLMKLRELFVAGGIAAVLAAAAPLLSSIDIVRWLFPFLSGSEVGVVPHIVPSGASTQERLVTLFGGWKMFLENPIFGAGLGAYRNQLILATSGIPLVIHSTALWLLAELGLIGFFAFAIPAMYVWFTEWRGARREQASALIVLCIAGFAVMSGPADMVYQRTFWLMIGAALALPRLSGSDEAVRSSDRAADVSRVEAVAEVRSRPALDPA